MKRILVFTLVLCLVAASGAQAFMSGNPTAGRELIVKKCMSCHTVPEEANAVTEDGAPGFDAIAADDNAYTLRSMRVALEGGHWPGRPEMLESKQADNVMAFVLSLRNAEEE
jgi:mono/diheme cytochrome c family protein